MRTVKYLIIGAGPTGLGAAYRLKDLGQNDFLVLERNPWIGGLSASFVDDAGFTWDIGGHVQFSHYKYFDDAMDAALGKDGWLDHERESWVWLKERFVPYPFQNNIRYLPRDVMWSCIDGLVEATKSVSNLSQVTSDGSRAESAKPKDFGEWIHRVFGRGIAEHFMLPYNFKVWAYPPKEMAYQWIGERVSVVDISRVLKNVLFEQDDVAWGPNNTFRFPKNGGTGAIWNAIGEIVGRDKILLNHEVQGISAGKKEVRLAHGEVIRFEHLLSTMPLDVLAGTVDEAMPGVRSTARILRRSSSNIVGIGLRGVPHDELRSKCWMYFPESNCPFYRVTLFSKYSPYNVPDIDQYFSLMTETSESSSKSVNHTTLIEDTIAGLVNTKLIDSPSQVVSKWHYRADYGYPTPSLERDAVLADVIPALEKLGIHSRGRFGGWKYEVSNQDHSFMQGVEWVERLELGQAEKTFVVEPA